MTLRIVAHMKARADKVEDARQVLKGLVEPTHHEPGCISYEMLQNTEDPTQFTFVEEWQDEGALEAHFGSLHIAALLERFDELMAEPLDLRKYGRVG